MKRLLARLYRDPASPQGSRTPASGRPRTILRTALVVASVLALTPIAAYGAPEGREAGNTLLTHVSQSVVVRYWAAHPDQAPERFAEVLHASTAAARAPATRTAAASACAAQRGRFNCDSLGLPQNEESVSACTANPALVLEGTNDYRGLLDPVGNFTGWHWSTNGGRSVKNEGLLPPVTLKSDPDRENPSGGDPVDFLYADSSGCHAFAASLALDPANAFENPNGIAVYRSEPSILSSCPGGSDPSCWPTRRLVVENTTGHFLDKEWMFVGNQAGVAYVWVTYSDFDQHPVDPDHAFEASIKAVRCTIDLVTCTGPIDISTVDEDVQFSDVTIGPDGRAYITWSRIDGELEGTPQTFTHKIRVETAPGTALFGAEQTIYAEDRAIPFGGFLQANDFRIATMQKSDVAWVSGHTRVFVVWDACKVRLLGNVCEFAEIKLSYSDDQGASWHGPFVISKAGVSYFPTISVDRANASNSHMSVAWFTNSYDPAFWNAQDVALVSLNTSRSSYSAPNAQRLTSRSNESEADPLLGGFFIGDYIEVAKVGNVAYVGYNANYRQIRLLGEGLPVNQQDNYLVKATP